MPGIGVQFTQSDQLDSPNILLARSRNWYVRSLLSPITLALSIVSAAPVKKSRAVPTGWLASSRS